MHAYEYTYWWNACLNIIIKDQCKIHNDMIHACIRALVHSFMHACRYRLLLHQILQRGGGGVKQSHTNLLYNIHPRRTNMMLSTQSGLMKSFFSKSELGIIHLNLCHQLFFTHLRFLRHFYAVFLQDAFTARIDAFADQNVFYRHRRHDSCFSPTENFNFWCRVASFQFNEELPVKPRPSDVTTHWSLPPRHSGVWI